MLRAERLFLFEASSPANFTLANGCPLVVTARRNQVREHIGIIAIVIPKRKLIQIERQIILADPMIGADNATLQQAPEPFDIVGMDVPAHVFAACRDERVMTLILCGSM